MQKCEDLEEPKQERNQKQENEEHVKVKLGVRVGVHTQVLKGVFLGVKRPILRGISNRPLWAKVDYIITSLILWCV